MRSRATQPAEPGGEWYEDPGWRQVVADNDASWAYLLEHHDELLARYPNERVALHRDRVVFHSADADEFERLLGEYLAATGIHPSALEMPYLDVDPPPLLV